MYSSNYFVLVLYAFIPTLAGTVAAAPLCADIINAAGGGLPNGGEPILISTNAVKEFQLALYLENLESFYFQTGLQNVSRWGTDGYPADTIEIIGRVAAQEEVHVTTITDLLMAYGAVVIPPCQYSFPVTSTDEFLALGNIITSVGISAIIGLADRISSTDPLVIKSVSSIVTVESRHDAFFRHVVGSVPNPTPFDTGISSIWAYNLALPFLVPGSCPVEIPIPILATLSVSSPPANTPSANTTVRPTIAAPYGNTTTSSFSGANATVRPLQMEFTWDPTQTPFLVEKRRPLFIGWINQLNVPAYTTLSITGPGKGVAEVPQEVSGVAFAVVTSQQPDNANDLALATLAGPVVLKVS